MNRDSFKRWLRDTKGYEENRTMDIINRLENSGDSLYLDDLLGNHDNLDDDSLLYFEYSKYEYIERIMNYKDIKPDKYDGSYELVRETLYSYMNVDFKKIGIEDIDLLYGMALGNNSVSYFEKIDKIAQSNLEEKDKQRLKEILNRVFKDAELGNYMGAFEGDNELGIFKSDFKSFKGLSTDEDALFFISICLRLMELDDEDEVLNLAEEGLRYGISGIRTEEASRMLHCLMPDVFPVVDRDIINFYKVLESKGVYLKNTSDIKFYIDNVREIKRFRDNQCIFRNYVVLYKSFLEMKFNEEIDILEPVGIKIEDDKFNKEEFLEELFLEEEDYDIIKRVLLRKKNIILKGPSGIGKTYLAKRIPYEILGYKNRVKVRYIEFHKNYSYEDFLSTELMELDTRKYRGDFYDICKKAEKDPKNQYFLIMDEINSDKLRYIFGESFSLIDKDLRGERVVLSKSKKNFSVPENLYIIGVFGSVYHDFYKEDSDILRRFAIFDLEPRFKSPAFKEHLIKNSTEEELADKIIERLSLVNDSIRNDQALGESYEIGHAYFCNEKIDETIYRDIINYEIKQLIYNYYEDKPEKAKSLVDMLL